MYRGLLMSLMIVILFSMVRIGFAQEPDEIPSQPSVDEIATHRRNCYTTVPNSGRASQIEFTYTYTSGETIRMVNYDSLPYQVTLTSVSPALNTTVMSIGPYWDYIFTDHYPQLTMKVELLDTTQATSWEITCGYVHLRVYESTYRTKIINEPIHYSIYLGNGWRYAIPNASFNVIPVEGEQMPRIRRQTVTSARGWGFVYFYSESVPGRYGFRVKYGEYISQPYIFEFLPAPWDEIFVQSVPEMMDEGSTVRVHIGLTKPPVVTGGAIAVNVNAGDCTASPHPLMYTPTQFGNLEIQVTANDNYQLGENAPCVIQVATEGTPRDYSSDVVFMNITIPIFDNEAGDIMIFYPEFSFFRASPPASTNAFTPTCDQMTGDLIMPPNNGLYCNPVSENLYGIPENVLALGVIRAHDLAYYDNGQSLPTFPDGQYRLACLMGQGRLFFGEASSSPRRWSLLDNAFVSVENGIDYTCAYLPSPGTLVLVNPES